MEDHSRAAAAQTAGARQCEQRAVGGDGDDRPGDADRMHERRELAVGEGGWATAGTRNPGRVGRKPRSYRSRTVARECVAWITRGHSWCGRSVRGVAVA